MVLLYDEKIGYIFKGGLQSMINDFLDRDDDVSADISKVTKSNVYINIYMFKSS